ncbi:MAG: formate dehydrogenase [Desulfobacteraceae bacterium]|nr:formate dehydrogenase [Pseudomonadota bacterium]MCG2755384.1 formate dehydrogenase [Desulfobacteraceae bacterium]
MSKSFFVDTTICTACRGCQVACKQWHNLPAEETTNRGTYENPADLSFITYKVVRMREQVIGGKLNWLFFPEQCRHCIEAPCLETAGDPGAIFRDDKTGAVIFTANTKRLDAAAIVEACPYNVPRKAADGTLAKCDMCLDRVENGMLPSCVQTCPTGAMQFGDRDEMLALAKKRLGEVKKTNSKAMLIDEDTVNVIYLVAYEPKLYCKNAVASNAVFDITRQMALKRMIRPLTNITSRLL